MVEEDDSSGIIDAYGELVKLAAKNQSDVTIGLVGDKLFVYYQKRRTPLGWVPPRVGGIDVVTAYTGRIRAAGGSSGG